MEQKAPLPALELVYSAELSLSERLVPMAREAPLIQWDLVDPPNSQVPLQLPMYLWGVKWKTVGDLLVLMAPGCPPGSLLESMVSVTGSLAAKGKVTAVRKVFWELVLGLHVAVSPAVETVGHLLGCPEHSSGDCLRGYLGLRMWKPRPGYVVVMVYRPEVAGVTVCWRAVEAVPVGERLLSRVDPTNHRLPLLDPGLDAPQDWSKRLACRHVP